MLYRKIEKVIREHFNSLSNKILLIDGARQIGKTYIIRHIGKSMFKNFIEINFAEDKAGEKNFADIKSVKDFYFKLNIVCGQNFSIGKDTLVFIDEIQAYPYFLTFLKFLKEDDKFTYICSGSLLGVTLSKTSSLPMGSISKIEMYPLDFEEFLLANGVGFQSIEYMYENFKNLEALDQSTHNFIFDLFKKYLIVGGLPECVNTFLNEGNIYNVRKIQEEIHEYYKDDASKYDRENKLKISRIYHMVPSNLENKKKRIVIQDIDNVKGKTFLNYIDEFDYLISSGICLDVKAISTPVFPLIQSSEKNLLKLYLNDVGILTSIYYSNNISAIVNDVRSINLGTVYETVVASELKAHGYNLYYYDNKKNGEVDFLIDDYNSLSVLPLEIKSGKDYKVHSAIDKFIENKDYSIKKGYVLSNERKVYEENNIIYMPIYYIMFFSKQ